MREYEHFSHPDEADMNIHLDEYERGMNIHLDEYERLVNGDEPEMNEKVRDQYGFDVIFLLTNRHPDSKI